MNISGLSSLLTCLEFSPTLPSGMNFGLPSELPRVADVGTADWSVWMDSNHRPRAYQARALTTWATNRYSRVSDSSHLTRVFLCFSFFLSSLSEKWRVKSEEWRDAFKQVWTLVEMMGFEPMTPCLQGRCSPNWATPPYHGLFSFQRPLPVPENWTTKDPYSTFCVPTSSTRMTGSWHPVPVSIERRWSSRTFRYGYLVTT